MIEISMQNLSSRQVKADESARLGVQAGWYATKVSGTFVGGPYATIEESQKKILELNPPPVVVKRKI